MKKIFIALFCCVALVGYGQECISGDCENGQGTMIYANGDKYVGEWKNGKPNGQGTYNYGVGPNDGDKYVGEWKDGSKHGQGSYTYANGDNYVGKFSNDKKWGQGVMVNNDGRILYSGIWVDDHPYE